MTVDSIVKALPIEGRAVKAGGFLYFSAPVKAGPEKAKAEADAGSIAYWPMASATDLRTMTKLDAGKLNIRSLEIRLIEVK